MKTIEYFAVRKCGYGWQVYSLYSPDTYGVFASYDLAISTRNRLNSWKA